MIEIHKLRVLLGSFSVDPHVEELMDVVEESDFQGFSLSVDVRGVVVADMDMTGERVVEFLWSGIVLFGRVGVLN